jgi:transposase
VVATVRFPSEDRRRWLHKTRTFKATLAGLSELADWLAGFAVTLVGMEATGVYWKPSFRRWRTGSSAGCSTLSTFATFPGGRPT